MATVTAFEIPGLTIWFYSNDHTPPHFHVKKAGEWELRVNFQLDDEMFEVKWSNRVISSRVKRKIRKLVEEHRADLQIQWDQIQEDRV